MKTFVEVTSGRPSPFKSPAATELVSVKGGGTAELQALSANTTHLTISWHVDDGGRSFSTIAPQSRRRRTNQGW